MSPSPRQLPIVIKQTPVILLPPRGDTFPLEIRPPARLVQLATRAEWSFLVPLGAALVFFYGRFFTQALLQVPSAEWALLGGVIAILLGWPLRTLLLAVLSKPLAGQVQLPLLFSLSAWATLPLTLREAVHLLYMVITARALPTPGLAGLVTQSSDAGLTGLAQVQQFVLGQIDFYTLWHLALLVTTVKVGAYLPTSKALLVVTVYCLLHLLVGLSLVWF